MAGNNNEGNNNGGGFGTVIAVIIVIIIYFVSCGDGSEPSNDIAYDPDGFMGYSDSFWEWWADQ